METRVFTKGALKSVNTMAQVQGYNRVTDEKFLERLPDAFYVPRYVLLHEHKAGQPCEPHVRCVFDHEGDMFTIDVEMGCWDKLPSSTDFIAAVRDVEQRRAAGDTSV
jgi:hypothetical protein